MSNNLQNHIRSTIRRALYGTLGIPMLALPVALAQQATNEPVKMEKTVVTGSLIPTAETVGPAPVDIVTAERIQQVGSQDVLATLKALNPGFAGNGNVGQTVNNGGFGEANVQLRNLSTLVLLNGRRLGNSAFSNGALVDVNTIPLSMIERVEILKDGASALYGSAAIGGVVNIITKKNYNGAEISGRVGFPTQDTSNDLMEYRASVVAGASSDKSSFTAGFQYYRMDPLLTKDRPLASEGILTRLDKNLAPPSYISPSFPGRVQDPAFFDPSNYFGTNGRPRAVIPAKSYVLAGSPFAAGAPGYNPSVSTPPTTVTGGPFGIQMGVMPDGSVRPVGGGVMAYNQAAMSQLGYSPYLDLATTPLGAALNGAGVSAYPLLNTTLFGTHSIQSQDRRQVFANGEHDLYGKEAQLFGQFLYSNNESVGALAPSPVISLYDPTANIFVPTNNAFNPFGINLGPVGGAANPRIRSRFVQSGNRIFDSLTDFYHIVGGLKGEFESGYSYEGAYTYNRYDQTQFTKNAVNGAALDAALRPNPDPAKAALGLSALRASNGDFVPMYNIFFTPTNNFPTRTGPNSPATIDALRTTLFQSGRAEEWDADGLIRGEPFDLPAGKLGFAVGGGFRSEALSIDFDGLTKTGRAPGLNPADPTNGRRDSYDLFAEVRIPVTSPDLNIPAFHSFEVTAAGRFESFAPGGDSAVPKVGVRWQPVDEQVTLRGSYSKSFVAPTTFQLFGGRALNNPFIFLSGDGSFAQESTVNLSNPGLKAVDAQNYGGGIVFSPKCVPGLTVSLDYFHIKTKNDIFRFSEQSMANDLEINGANSAFASFFRFNDQTPLTSTNAQQITSANWGSMNVPLGNGAQTETDGLDLSASYRLSQWQETAGVFTFYVAANVLFNYKYQDPLIGGPFQYKGFYTDRANGIGGGQGLIPDWQLNTGVTWEYPIGNDSLALTVNARYIPEVDDPGTLFASNLNFENTVDDGLNDFTVDGSKWKIPSWYSIDMQLAYELGKNKEAKDWYDGTRLTIGVNNITDEKPPIIASSFEDNTDKSTYDLLGRFVYFELAKKF